MKKNIVFMGTPEFSAFILEELSKFHNVSLVLTQTDKEVGRKKILTPSPVKEIALKLNLELAQPKSLRNNEEIRNLISNKKPDFIIVAAYGKILPKEILDIAPCINTHASLLPYYRGASPIQSAILNGDIISGVTLMNMDIGLDTGDILYQQELNIKDLNSPQVFDKMSKLSAKMLLEFLENPNYFQPIKQDDSKATHTKIIKKQDGLIELNNAKEIYQKYLAFYDWPNIFLENGLKLNELELNECESDNKEGLIKEIGKNYLILTCKKGSLKVYKLQDAGKKSLDANVYVNGKRLKQGDSIV
ncbi:methionyl-tRNA formyltransferase [Campylobacter sp. RM12637]|uniref:methionyl-tRNA formyltransferase n=1 Tax=Campylobacter sp. RM12637 TaxID=2735734 RepID=UPI0030143FFA|nr:methionyl-tRNA formyltransferase [Campylobacter sp. RM12637]